MSLLVLEVLLRALMLLSFSDEILGYGDSVQSPFVFTPKQNANIAEKVLGLGAACQPGILAVPGILELPVLFPIENLHVQVRHRPFVLDCTLLVVGPGRERPGSQSLQQVGHTFNFTHCNCWWLWELASLAASPAYRAHARRCHTEPSRSWVGSGCHKFRSCLVSGVIPFSTQIKRGTRGCDDM